MSTEARAFPFPTPGPLEPSSDWAELRRQCPVAPVRMPSGDEVRLVTRYADARELLADPRFSRTLPPGSARLTAAGNGVFEERGEADIASGPAHTRWRRLVGRTFTARRIEGLRPRVEAFADELVDRMSARPDGAPVDLVGEFALPLPVRVICELLGVPVADQPRFTRWSETMLTFTRHTAEEVAAGRAEFAAYVRELVAAKRAEPGDDLLSELTAVSDADDGRLSEAELVLTAVGLLAAGHETTANAIAKGVALLLAEPARYRSLVEEAELIPSTVEELLRFDPNPGVGLPRYLHEETEVGGVRLPAGSTVLVSLASVNRDETVFAEADRLDLGRRDNPHLAFGVGPHFCLGHALARLELRVALATLVRRLPDLRLAVPADRLRRREGLLVGGLTELPVTW